MSENVDIVEGVALEDLYPLIQSFSSIFSLLKFDNPKGAAAYYVLLNCIKYPCHFKDISKLLITLSDRDASKIGRLRAGRDELLNKGIIAKEISKGIITEKIEKVTKKIEKTGKIDFGSTKREEYLPICPLTIWRENKSGLDGLGFKDPEIETAEARVKNLTTSFHNNFYNNGLGIKSGSITILYTKDWILNKIIHVMQNSKVLSMMLSGLGTFEGTQRIFYETMLKRGLIIRAIFDRNENFKGRIEIIKKLRHDREDQFQIRFSPIKYATSRRITLENIAIDARKLLIINAPTSYYIGTAYLEMEDVSYLRSLFESTWKLGILEEDIDIFQDEKAAKQIRELWKDGVRDRCVIANGISTEKKYSTRAVRAWIGNELNNNTLQPEG